MFTRSELAAPGVWVQGWDCRGAGDRSSRATGRLSRGLPRASARSWTHSAQVISLTIHRCARVKNCQDRPRGRGFPDQHRAGMLLAAARSPRHRSTGGASFGFDHARPCGGIRVRSRWPCRRNRRRSAQQHRCRGRGEVLGRSLFERWVHNPFTAAAQRRAGLENTRGEDIRRGGPGGIQGCPAI